MPDASGPARTPMLIAAGVVGAILVLGMLWWALSDRGSDDDVESADRRTSDPAEPTDAAPGDTTTTTTDSEPEDQPQPTGEDPAIALDRAIDLDRPSAMADPPGPGPVLVTTLDGRIHRVDLDSGSSEVVLDLSEHVSVGGERGLLGLAVDPGGERMYVNFTDTSGDTDIRSWPLADGRPDGGPDDGVVHLELGQPYANHNGGHLVFGPEGLLWIGTGDGGGAGDPDDVAQDPDRLLGKMLRVAPDPSGGVTAPASNPDWDGRPEVWAIGLRNPWRYSFDRATERLWIADVGQNTTEEVSVVEPDAERPNFGWNEMEGDQTFDGQPDPSFISPVVTYGRDSGCSITGGYVYRGSSIDSLHGWYLFGDYCSGFVRAVPADAPEQEPVELVSDAGPVLSFGQLEDGELVVLTATGIKRIVGP